MARQPCFRASCAARAGVRPSIEQPALYTDVNINGTVVLLEIARTRQIKKFVVTPSLPEKLQPLLEIARNIWWTWDTEAISLLRRVSPDLWDKFSHNPVAVLGSLNIIAAELDR